MPLVTVPLEPLTGPLPTRAEDLIRYAEHRAVLLQESEDVPYGFVPSDYRTLYGYLAALEKSFIPTGRAFCEWGSGLGVITCLAALLEFDACGIEIHADLVQESRLLAERFGLAAQFARGSFIPPGGEAVVDRPGEWTWLVTEGPDAYSELLLDPDDFDVVFSYPWPGEEEVVFALFERFAASGAVLLTYHGLEGVELRRNQARQSRRRS